MKIRLGFVSNSSSSSFTCLICGGTESGMDMCLDDAGMYRCENGHLFCDSHLIKKELTIDEKREELINWYKEEEPVIRQMPNEEIEKKFGEVNKHGEGGTNRYDTMSCLCPICNLYDVPDDSLTLYLLKKLGDTRDKVVKEIKEKYKNFNEFSKFIHNR